MEIPPLIVKMVPLSAKTVRYDTLPDLTYSCIRYLRLSRIRQVSRIARTFLNTNLIPVPQQGRTN